MLNNIIDIIGDADISISDIRFYIAIALIVFLIVYIPLSKYGKALNDEDIEKTEHIRSTMCIVYLSIMCAAMLIAALVFAIMFL